MRKLSKIQKNVLYGLIEEAGLQPALFEYHEGVRLGLDSAAVSGISVRYRPQVEYAFRFEDAEDDFNWFCCIDCFPSTSHRLELCADFLECKRYFEEWLGLLKVELESVDRWQQMEQILSEEALAFGSVGSEAYFSVAELHELQSRLASLKGQLAEIGLHREQLQTLTARIDHLSEMGDRLTKKDWVNMLIGSVISWLVAQGLDAALTHQIWSLLKQLFTQQLFLP